MKTYKDLLVWQKSIQLVKKIYKLTGEFPSTEKFGLSSQMQRSAVSIPSNIAEGRLQSTNKHFIQFLRVALGSCAELQTQIVIANEIGYIRQNVSEESQREIDEIMKMITGLIKRLLEPKA